MSVQKIRTFFKETLLLARFLLKGRGSGTTVILAYHSIGKRSAYRVPSERFEQQVAYLKKHFSVVRLCDLRAAMDRRSATENIACITFDDGCADNYETALPILQRHGLKATFFIATSFLGKTINGSYGSIPMLEKEQVRGLADAGSEIGAHTVTHPKLTRISLEEARKEIAESKKSLENIIGTQIFSFAYPKGYYNEEVESILAETGFTFAVTIDELLVPVKPDWLVLPRIWISGDVGINVFRAKISPAMNIGKPMKDTGHV